MFVFFYVYCQFFLIIEKRKKIIFEDGLNSQITFNFLPKTILDVKKIRANLLPEIVYTCTKNTHHRKIDIFAPL